MSPAGVEQEQQAAIDTWTAGMGLAQPDNELPWVEMPVIDEPGFVMRWVIDTGMQRGIPDKVARSHVWTAYTNRKAFLKSCGIDSMHDIHVLVVARDGTILAMESGRHSEAGAERILAGCGKTACCTSGMTCRERSSRENRRFSSVEKRPEDFFHGQLAALRRE